MMTYVHCQGQGRHRERAQEMIKKEVKRRIICTRQKSKEKSNAVTSRCLGSQRDPLKQREPSTMQLMHNFVVGAGIAWPAEARSHLIRRTPVRVT